MTDTSKSVFPWPEDQVAHYTAFRVPESLLVDGSTLR